MRVIAFAPSGGTSQSADSSTPGWWLFLGCQRLPHSVGKFPSFLEARFFVNINHSSLMGFHGFPCFPEHMQFPHVSGLRDISIAWWCWWSWVSTWSISFWISRWCRCLADLKGLAALGIWWCMTSRLRPQGLVDLANLAVFLGWPISFLACWTSLGWSNWNPIR